MAAILDIWVKMMLKRESDVRIVIRVVDLVEKVYLYLILCALIQKLIIFQDGDGGHLGYFGQDDVLASNWIGILVVGLVENVLWLKH